MKAKYMFVLSVVFFATTLQGFSQAFWNQPESAKWGIRQFNSNAAQQISRASGMMTMASVMSATNPDWAKQKAEDAEAQMKQAATQGNNNDINQALKDMIASIIAFIAQLKEAQAQQMQSLNRS